MITRQIPFPRWWAATRAQVDRLARERGVSFEAIDDGRQLEARLRITADALAANPDAARPVSKGS